MNFQEREQERKKIEDEHARKRSRNMLTRIIAPLAVIGAAAICGEQKMFNNPYLEQARPYLEQCIQLESEKNALESLRKSLSGSTSSALHPHAAKLSQAVIPALQDVALARNEIESNPIVQAYDSRMNFNITYAAPITLGGMFLTYMPFAVSGFRKEKGLRKDRDEKLKRIDSDC